MAQRTMVFYGLAVRWRAAGADTGWVRIRGADSRRSASQANSRARWRARSVSPPSWLAWIRHAMRLMSHARFPDRVSSPQTSANFARSSLTVIRCSAATSCVTFNTMFCSVLLANRDSQPC